MTNKTIYRCHGCGVYIGDVNDDGTLTVHGLRLVTRKSEVRDNFER